MSTVLIVEDDESVAGLIAGCLAADGLATEVAHDGESGLAAARRGGHDLVVLDLGLPGLSGGEVLRRIRGEEIGIPVIALTARPRGEAFGSAPDGADDHLSKPFRPSELLARVRARLAPGVAVAGVVRGAGILLDPLTRRVYRSSDSVPLAEGAFALAEALLERRGEVVTRAQLAERVWGRADDPRAGVVHVHVEYLNRVLGQQVATPVNGARFLVADPPHPRRRRRSLGIVAHGR